LFSHTPLLFLINLPSESLSRPMNVCFSPTLCICLSLSLSLSLYHAISVLISPTSLGLSPTLCLSVYLTPYVYVALSSPMSMWLSPPLCLSVFSPMTVCLLPYVCLALPTLCVFLSIPVLTFLLPHVYAHPTLRLSLCWIKLKKIQNVILKKVLIFANNPFNLDSSLDEAFSLPENTLNNNFKMSFLFLAFEMNFKTLKNIIQI